MNVTNREAGQRDEVGDGVGVGGWRWGWCHIWKAPLLSDQTTSCWTLIRLGAKANTPSWVCSLCDSCVFSPLHDCFCIINHRENPELINKTQEGNTKQLGFFFFLSSAMAYESWEAWFLFWVLVLDVKLIPVQGKAGAKHFPQQK